MGSSCSGWMLSMTPKQAFLIRKEPTSGYRIRFLAKKVKELNGRLRKGKDPKNREKRFFCGASVSPNRKDWREELEFVVRDENAVLLKLIPSAQHIHLRDPKHKAFYKFLADNHLPLLCHVGPEYSFPEGIREWRLDNFRYLDRPLECGVTVIGAHCATPGLSTSHQ